MESPLPAEPLAEIAAHAAAIADATCSGCGWYHGAWPLWRLLGMASAPTVHEAFYAEHVARHVAGGGGADVLVSGAADQGMVATVARAFAAVGVTPRITVLDRCATPLRLAEAWAGPAGVPVRTVRVDVLDLAEIAAFDLVCTHAFLGYFDPAQRRRLATRWRAALRPGGRLVTLNRLRPTAPTDPVGFTADEAAAFVARARAAAPRVGWDPEDAVARALAWTERFRMYALREAEDVTGPLQAAGFAVEVVAIDSGEASRTAPVGPGTPGHASFLGFVGSVATPA